MARLVPIEQPQKPRRLGRDQGSIWMAEDFDAPLAELEEVIYGNK